MPRMRRCAAQPGLEPGNSGSKARRLCQFAHRARGMCAAEAVVFPALIALLHLDSNQESPSPELGGMPVTPWSTVRASTGHNGTIAARLLCALLPRQDLNL